MQRHKNWICRHSDNTKTNRLMNFMAIKMKIVPSSVCVYSACRKRQEGTRRAWPALRQLFLVPAENFDGDSMVVGTNSRGSGGKKKVCESCGTVGNSDPLPHSAGTGGLHVGYQQNRRRGRAAKPII